MKYRSKSSTPRAEKYLVRDPHDPGKLYVHVRTLQAPVIERNKQIRSSKLMQTGRRFDPIDEYAEVTASFQFPTVIDYQLARQKYSDLFAQLEEGGEKAVRAGEHLAFLFPQYVTTVKRRDVVAVSRREAV